MREALWHKHYCISSAYIIITIFILYEVACYFCHLFKVPFYMMCTYRCGYFVLRVAGGGHWRFVSHAIAMQHATCKQNQHDHDEVRCPTNLQPLVPFVYNQPNTSPPLYFYSSYPTTPLFHSQNVNSKRRHH